MKRHFHTSVRTLRRAAGSGSPSKDVQAIKKTISRSTTGIEPPVDIKSLEEIQEGLNSRYFQQYFKPSKKWFSQNFGTADQELRNFLNIDPLALTPNEKEHLVAGLDPTAFNKDTNTFFLDPTRLLRSPLDVGDVVLLRSNPSQLCMCVEVPTDIADPRYTFATIDGHMKFGTRNMVLLRMPSFHRRAVSDLVQEETTVAEMNRIGTVKNSPERSYILPVVARQMFTSYVPYEITQAAWNNMPLITRKLELLHRYLQKSSGPWQVSLFTLCKLVMELDLPSCRSLSPEEYIPQVFQKAGLSGNFYALGDQNFGDEAFGRISAAEFLATYWALIQQQEDNLWGKIHVHRAMLTPISVTVLPLESHHLFYERAIAKLEAKDYARIKKFASFVNDSNFKAALQDFPEIVRLLKDYAGNNFNNSGQITVIISKIFRHVERFKDRDVSRDLCHDLLKLLIPDMTINPLLLNNDLALPIASNRAALEERLLNIVEPVLTEDSGRHDFGNMNVYCIDAETAHEIDDGISIEWLEENLYALHIHIADPVSLFENASSSLGFNDVFNVAFQRGFTTYLPDTVLPMLPTKFCRAADMGQDGVRTKTISFSVNVRANKDDINVDADSFKIRLGLVSNFPKFTYNDVDQVLDKSKHSSSNIQEKELFMLYQMALLLRSRRVKDHNAIIFGEGFNNGFVSLNSNDVCEPNQINFSDQRETKSTILVSEMMILANTLAGKFFAKNEIPGIFRCYKELPLKAKAQEAYRAMQRKSKFGELPGVKEITKVSALLNSSFYAGNPSQHDMIGANEYLTVTSPMRRFADLVNHLQIYHHLERSTFKFDRKQIDKIAAQIQSRDVILKNLSRQCQAYWTLKFLRSLMEKDPNFTVPAMVTAVPDMGSVRCVLPHLSAAKGILKLNLSKDSTPIIGDIIPHCTISKLDCLDGLIELEIAS
ncbi:LAMI_0G01134g1_1 [Lachancea mirantina]|uniref:LAMI_0G01134g1_1 n=1 Tax=Lachancea mirantina TaxID=1230905 RepID=A0A1G4K7B0_9SACH|nr:LAMI_0G01134g1_1 [Lachancea mirantina]